MRGSWGVTEEFNYNDFLKKCILEEKSSKEPFVLHYKAKYSQPENLPSWMAGELLSFGAWSILYRNLSRADKKNISDVFKLSPIEFGSCLHLITQYC